MNYVEKREWNATRHGFSLKPIALIMDHVEVRGVAFCYDLYARSLTKVLAQLKAIQIPSSIQATK